MSERQARLESAAARYEQGAAELETAARHLHTTARCLRDVPRAAAHAWAGRGHILKAQEVLDQLAQEHAERSSV